MFYFCTFYVIYFICIKILQKNLIKYSFFGCGSASVSMEAPLFLPVFLLKDGKPIYGKQEVEGVTLKSHIQHHK